MDISRLNWVITGAGGLLAQDLMGVLTAAGARVRALPRASLDITSEEEVRAALARADVVVNCAAYTAVDLAEAEQAKAHLANAYGPQVLARVALDMNVRLVHISTDYVFAGSATSPYAEHHPPAPQNAYGRTKADGERAIQEVGGNYLIVRTAWLYGAGGDCFPKTIYQLAKSRPELQVVADQIGQPTWSRDLAEFIVRLVSADAPAGIYHGTSTGQASWFEFAQAILASGQLNTPIHPVTADQFPRPAARPAWSVLGHNAHIELGIPGLGPWEERWREAAPLVLGLPDS